MEDEVPRNPADRGDARALVDALVAARDAEHAAQVRQVELIGALCDTYATLPAGPVLPGHERLVPAGGDGTPLVAEHLATELAPRLRRTILSTAVWISQCTDLLHRHPHTWAATKAGQVPVWQATHIAAATHTAGLSREAAAWVDQQLAPTLGRLPWGRTRHKLAGLIVRADTVLAAQRAAHAQAARFVRIRHHGDGTALIIARTDAADAHHLHHTLTQLAGQLTLAGYTQDSDELRALALGILARPDHAHNLLTGPDTPTAQGTPRRRRRRTSGAQLVIHLAPGSPVGRCEQLGPVLAHQVKQWVGHDHVTVHPVVDLTDNPAVDSYEIPDTIARIVRWRNPHDVFPWATRPSKGLDLDHTNTFQHGPHAPSGQTCPDNLGPLTRRAHNAKTHAGWHLTQPSPGVFEWTSPLGYRYRVDQTGSHHLAPPGQPKHPPKVFPFTVDLTPRRHGPRG